MKKILISCIAISFAIATKAQTTDKVVAQVKYRFTHLKDTTQRDRLYEEDMLLLLGTNSSIYTSYTKMLRDQEIKKSIQEQVKNQAGSTNISIKSTSTKQASRDEYYYFPGKNHYFLKQRLINNYLIETPIDKIDWKITKDTLSIAGVACQKATARFKGRNWIAWFAPELPFQSGPWKLNGLPGLIVEAYDEKKEVKFEFEGFEKFVAKKADDKSTIPLQGGNVVVKSIGLDDDVTTLEEIKLPADGIKTTKKEYDRLQEAYKKDPQGFMQTQMAGSGTKIINVVGRPMPGGTTAVKPLVENNPIELSDK